jgi:RNA polymerase sigma-70 factor (ECF subfamily)
MKADKLSDNELVLRYQSGDECALKTLIQRYEKRLFSYILVSVKNKELAEDIFQDTFIKVINTIRSGNYYDEGKFFQWIMRIANNLKVDYYRRSQKIPIMAATENYDALDFLTSKEESVEQMMVREQVYADLDRVVEHLPAEQREVLKLRIYNDYSFKEIAAVTGVSINTALGRMRYAILNMRKLIRDHQISVEL